MRSTIWHRLASIPGVLAALAGCEASFVDRRERAAGDLKPGTPSSSSGAQSHVVPRGDGGRRWAWVFCEPFAGEIARAELTEVQP